MQCANLRVRGLFERESHSRVLPVERLVGVGVPGVLVLLVQRFWLVRVHVRRCWLCTLAVPSVALLLMTISSWGLVVNTVRNIAQQKWEKPTPNHQPT